MTLARHIPNGLGVFRCAAALYIGISIWMKTSFIPGASNYQIIDGVLLSLAICSDYADGKIARAFHWESTFGKILDPIADKLLCWAIITNYLGIHPTLPYWLPVFCIAGYDAAVLALRSIGLIRNVLQSAKLKTAILMAAVGFAFLELVGVGGTPLAQVALTLFWLSGMMVVISGSYYVRHLRATPG